MLLSQKIRKQCKDSVEFCAHSKRHSPLVQREMKNDRVIGRSFNFLADYSPE